mmetsp:Transcript_124635/g.360576  ORF Transcript_124635/g.360576 Transcript_124635/m.360576 type:complete len:233 (-) Transcript_124635:443-1141(-)
MRSTLLTWACNSFCPVLPLVKSTQRPPATPAVPLNSERLGALPNGAAACILLVMLQSGVDNPCRVEFRSTWNAMLRVMFAANKCPAADTQKSAVSETSTSRTMPPTRWGSAARNSSSADGASSPKAANASLSTSPDNGARMVRFARQTAHSVPATDCRPLKVWAAGYKSIGACKALPTAATNAARFISALPMRSPASPPLSAAMAAAMVCTEPLPPTTSATLSAEEPPRSRE